MSRSINVCDDPLWRVVAAGVPLAACLLLPSCASAPPPNPLLFLVQQQREELDALKPRLQSLEERFAALDEERRLRVSAQHCKDGTVARFMAELRRAPENACSEVDADNALRFMYTQRWPFAWLRPEKGLSDLHPRRDGAIRRNLDPKLLRTSIQVLVMVQPHEETLAADERAKRVGDAVRDHIKELLPPPMRQTQVLPTYRLPCTLQRSRGKLNRYRDADGNLYSHSWPGEAGPNEARIAVWIFFTDC